MDSGWRAVEAKQDAWMVNRFTCQRMQNRRQAPEGTWQRMLRLLRAQGLLCLQGGPGCTV